MASSSGSSDMGIRKFDGTNFNFWKEQMQDYLIVRGYIDPIEHDTAPATYKPATYNDCLQRVGSGREVLRDNELHFVGRRPEENVRSEHGE
jgi:hypothetical protein